MSFNTNKDLPVTQNVPIMPEQLATNQQTVPAPLWWGSRKIALRWITPALNQIAVQAPDTVPTKK
ncbi:MAG TPA: hypothetical protein VG167_00870 [Verrucomicrobiae bacterium]|nr:hypothetical protein [Verrucomicrobiae bacterium]